MPLLSLLIVLPVLGAIVVAMLPARRSEVVLPVAIGVSIAPLALALHIMWIFDSAYPGPQFTEFHSISDTFGLSWSLGIDGVSLFMVVLTTILFTLSIAASRSIQDRQKTYMAILLLLEAACIGVFLALDLIVFFAFFEFVLIPMYLLILIWGSGDRARAALKFVLFTAFGSAFLLAGIIALALLAGDTVGAVSSFNYVAALATNLSHTTQIWLFLAFGIGFAIKVPMFPFHTWLPDAHTQAPTAGSVILAGILLKLGAYGFIRFNMTLFPDATVSLGPILAVLGAIGVIYGAAAATVQPDFKRVIAYSSVSHMGFVLLGAFALTSQGLQGSVYVMISHGLITGALFLLIGMIYDRTHTRIIADYGGLAKIMPVYAGFFLFAVFASVGLPTLSGFIGEFLVLIGSYMTQPAAAIVAAFGVILAAIYLLWMYERIFHGPVVHPKIEALKDLNFREVAIMVPLVVLIIGLGVYPKPVLDRIQPSVEIILDRIESVTGHEAPEFGRFADLSAPVGSVGDTATSNQGGGD